MRRDSHELSSTTYDVIIVGGGIHGACLAWDAALRGLSAALVEKSDFGAATSGNTLKIIHGGLRHLQHGHLRRVRESIGERRNLMRIAPHFVHPLPTLIPTYGHGSRGPELFALGLAVYDVMSIDRNRGLAPDKHTARGRMITRRQAVGLVPGLDGPELNGAALVHDAQAYNPDRLLLAFLRSAAKAGAHLANYVEVVGFIRVGAEVAGVQAIDRLSGERFDVRGRTVINATGPWMEHLLGLCPDDRPTLGVSFVKAINLVTRSLTPGLAIGLPSPVSHRDRDALIDRRGRLLFVIPWRGRSLVGTAYFPVQGSPDDIAVTGAEAEALVRLINRAYPAAELSLDDVLFVHCGLVPTSGPATGLDVLGLATADRIVDHRRDGLTGLVSVVGVKYTTARLVAERVIDGLFRSRGRRPPKCLTAVTPLHGGDIENFETFLHREVTRHDHRLGESCVRRLVQNHGSAYLEVLRHLPGRPAAVADTVDPWAVQRAEVLHAIRAESAQTLGDVVFRRTELATAGDPGGALLERCTRVMSEELAWSPERTQSELWEVRRRFP